MSKHQVNFMTAALVEHRKRNAAAKQQLANYELVNGLHSVQIRKARQQVPESVFW